MTGTRESMHVSGHTPNLVSEIKFWSVNNYRPLLFLCKITWVSKNPLRMHKQQSRL